MLKSASEMDDGHLIISKPKGGILSVKLWEGRNLAAKDEEGTSDPYCLYGFIDEKDRWIEKGSTRPQKSATIYQTLNPTWNTKWSHFEIPSDTKPNFRVQVWDKDKIVDDFMGHFIIQFSKLEDNKTITEWITLDPRDGKDEYVSGDVKISYTYRSKETLLREFSEQTGKEPVVVINFSGHSIDEVKESVTSWITGIKDADTFSECISKLETLYKWTETSKENALLLQQFQLFPNLFISLTTRLGSFSNKKKEADLITFYSISCGLIGNLAQHQQLHPDLFKYNFHDFCLRHLQYLFIATNMDPNIPLLIIYPFYHFTCYPETGQGKAEYIYGLTPALGELLQEMSDYNSKWVPAVTLISAVLANIAQKFGVDSFKNRIIPHIGKLFVNWVGNEEILSQASIIIYCINNSANNEDHLTTLSSAVVQGLVANVLSQFPGKNFEESEQLVLIVIPLLALFTWICHTSVLTMICNARMFAVLSKVLKLHIHNTDIVHNIINIFYGCLTRAGKREPEALIKMLSNVAYILVPSLTKAIKVYNRHQHIFTLGKEIIQILEEPQIEEFTDEFNRCGTFKLLNN